MGEVIPNGTKVLIKDAGIKATVQACCVAGVENPIIEYRLVYWVGGERKSDWVYDWEIEIFIDTSKKAGMVNYETDTDKLIEL